MARIGRYQNSSGPGLASVGSNEQLVSATVNHASGSITVTRMGAWMGKFSGSPIVRLALYWDDSGAPGDVARYTSEITPTENYTGGGGGKMHTANLTSPVVIPAGHKIWVGITSRNGTAGIAMIPSGDISEPNEQFYRKGISGNTPESNRGVSGTTNGQLMIWAEDGGGGGGGTGSLPYAPEIITAGILPAGNLTPTFQFRHRDPDGDRSSRATIQVRKGTEVIWTEDVPRNVANNEAIGISYAGEEGLAYGVVYQLRARTTDAVGNVGPYTAWTNFVIYQANVAPNKPSILSPRGNMGSSPLKPLFSMRHTDANGDIAKSARMQVRFADGSSQTWNRTLSSINVPSGNPINLWYDGSHQMQYYREYEWRGQVSDGQAWGEWSDWVPFTLYHDNKAPHPPAVQPPFPENFKRPSDVRANGFNWIFTDPDALLPGMIGWERTSTVQVIIRNRATGVNAWDSGNITPAAKYHGDHVYLGFPSAAMDDLQYNVDYDVYYIHRDRRGAANSVKRTMRLTPGASVEKPSTPSGRITDYANPGTITAKYEDDEGSPAREVQVRLVNRQGVQLAFSEVMPKVVNSGDTFTIPWSSIEWRGGDGNIYPGREVGIEVRARHNLSNYMTDWSLPTYIQPNDTPAVPTPVSPAHGAAFSTKPTLVVTAVDPDQAPGELEVTFQVATDPAFDNIVATTAGVMVSGGNNPGDVGRFERDLSSASIVLGNNYWWRAYSYDGTLYSGRGTTIENADPSTARMFAYANVPGVSITSPAQIAVMSPTFTWTSTLPQERYRLWLTDQEGDIVYDSGTVTSPVMQHQVQQSNWIGDHAWNNEETLTLTVEVFSVIWGTSPPLDITLVYDYPDTPTSVTAEAITPTGHRGTTAIRIQHDPSGYSESDHAGWRYYRSEISGPGDEVGNETRTLILEHSSMIDTVMEDWNVTSGQWYRYEVSQMVYSGVDKVESLTMSADAMAQWDGVVIHLPYQPILYNIYLRASEAGADYEINSTITSNREILSGGGHQVAAFGNGGSSQVEGVFGISDRLNPGMTGRQMVNRLIEIMMVASGRKSPDGLAHIVCWREGRGTEGSIVYGVFGEDTDIRLDGRYRNVWSASIIIDEVNFVLGEADPAPGEVL